VYTETLNSSVVPTLVHASENKQMVVIGSRGTGALGRLLLGSVSTGLVHHSSCPVAVIRPEPAPSDSDAPVLLGIDGSPASEAATALAFDEASRRGVGLVALHAWSDVAVFPMLGMDWHEYESQGHEILGERLAGWQEEYPDVHVQRRLVCDQPARWLIRESQHAQLVVVGSRGRGGFASTWLGSVSSAVGQCAAVAVVVVRDTPPDKALDAPTESSIGASATEQRSSLMMNPALDVRQALIKFVRRTRSGCSEAVTTRAAVAPTELE
jgi:nucleotide-binding universal stress UspA family protein